MNEPVNEAIRKHEEGVEDWKYGPVARQLYPWYERFNRRFFNGLVPSPVLSFQRTRCTRLGHYVPGRNDVGARDNINMNPICLADSFAVVLEVLCHEMVHSWQEHFGRPGAGNYHNQECCSMMLDIGIPCDSRGCRLGMRDPFVSFLRENGVEAAGGPLPVTVSQVAVQVAAMPPAPSRLKKWRCDCTNIRAAVKVEAMCLRCGQRFVPV